ncbi:MAG: hypothetical protein ABIN01_21905 [Ferruginibacter sp.]
MIITKQFIYIHRPKTGGSFVTDALLKIYDGKWNWLIHAKLALLGEIRFTNRLGTLTINSNKHGGCNEIPQKYHGKNIVSTIRNPFDYYVSQYEFGWWKRKNWWKYYSKVDHFNERFASFPNISFTQFMELMTAVFNKGYHKDFYNENAAGRYTAEFVQDYFYQPAAALAKLQDANNNEFDGQMHPVKFIFTHQLNQQLHDYLLESGYPQQTIDFILKKEKVLPQGKGRSEGQKWEKYYTPEMKELVRKKDRLLFELFPEFDAME